MPCSMNVVLDALLQGNLPELEAGILHRMVTLNCQHLRIILMIRQKKKGKKNGGTWASSLIDLFSLPTSFPTLHLGLTASKNIKK